jgi:threonine dehydratase
LYEATNGVKGGTLAGKPVIVLAFMGAKSRKIRKTPLMRIEHNGTYAVVASNAGAAALAALIKERDQMRGRRVGLVLSGGNIDRATYERVRRGDTHQP